MNKKALSAALASKTGLTQAKAAEVVTAIFDAENGIIADELKKGGKVSIPGFGTFGTKTRAARTGINPATQKQISIPEKNVAFFKVGKTLGERIEG